MTWTRLSAVLALVLHLLVAGGAALAHAQHGPGEERGRTHIESADQGPCPEHRRHAECPYCRLPGDRAEPAPDADLLPFLRTTPPDPLRPPRTLVPRPSVRAPSLPRAPPYA